MESTSNLQVIVDLYAAFTTGNAAAMSRPFNDQSVWVEPGNNTRSGVFRGPQAIAEHTTNCMQLTDGTWGTDVQEIVGGDRYVIVVERALGQRNGKSLGMMCCTMYEMADGAVAEMRVLPFDAQVWDDFWS
jgi:ketosteroid isomerase-like protein